MYGNQDDNDDDADADDLFDEFLQKRHERNLIHERHQITGNSNILMAEKT